MSRRWLISVNRSKYKAAASDKQTRYHLVWYVCEEPWELEEQLIRSLNLSLNLDQNRVHGFHPELSRIRREAKARARELPILSR